MSCTIACEEGNKISPFKWHGSFIIHMLTVWANQASV